MLELSPWAAEILRRSDEAARRLNAGARIRLVARAGAIEPVLADAPEPGDVPLDADGTLVFADPGLDGLVDVEPPHDRLVLKPPGARPSVRPAE